MTLSDDLIIERVLAREGGFVDNPHDRGGPTKYGITQETLASWRGLPVTPDDVRTLGKDEAKSILRFRYVVQPGFDHIEDGSLRAVIVDIAVNSGARQAVLLLQRALDVTDDGILGPETLEAANEKADDERAMAAVAIRTLTARQRFYSGLVAKHPDQIAFLVGWTERAMSQIEALL